MITIDAVRADHVGAYGHGRDTTPHLDALADRGLRYAYALSPAPWSAPAHAALLTGHYPERLGFTDLDGAGLDPGVATLPELFEARGYTTRCVLGHEFVHPRFGLTQGVRQVDASALGVRSGPARHAAVTDAALELIDGASGRGTFLWVHYEGPRAPFEAPDVRAFHHDDQYGGLVERTTSLRGLLEVRGTLDATDRAEVSLLYDEELRRVDAELGRLLAGLADSALADAIVCVTAPHGYALGERGHFGDAALLHDDLVRVPWVMAGGDLARGVIHEPVSLVDVAPTLFVAAGCVAHEDDPPMEGVPALPSYPAPTRPLYASTSRAVELRAVVEGDLKLIRDLRTNREDVYDVYADPDEALELSGSRAIEKDALGRRLDARFPRR